MVLSGTQNVPPVSWDQESARFCVSLSGVKFSPHPDSDHYVKIFYQPQNLYRMRIRKSGEQSWTPGFITPLPEAGFSLLCPNTEYEVEVVRVDSNGNPLTGDKAGIEIHKVRSDDVVEDD